MVAVVVWFGNGGGLEKESRLSRGEVRLEMAVQNNVGSLLLLYERFRFNYCVSSLRGRQLWTR